MSARGWTLFYVHRFLRLSPAFYVLVIFYTFVFKQMIRESPISMNELVTQDKCSESWWVEFFYMHNWADFREMCLGYSWYLDADMQMFLFTPLLIIPLAIKPLWGLIVAAVIFAISTAVNIGLVVRYHWPVMYANPLIRCQIYIMGMLVGWLLQTRKQLRIHPIVYQSVWAVSACLMLTVLFGARPNEGHCHQSVWKSNVLGVESAGLGHRALDDRDTVPVIHYALSLTKDEVYFSSFIEFFLFRVVAITAATYFLAVFWSACFELSFGRVEKLLICGVRAEKAADEEELISREEEEEERDDEAHPEPDNSLLRVPESQA